MLNSPTHVFPLWIATLLLANLCVHVCICFFNCRNNNHNKNTKPKSYYSSKMLVVQCHLTIKSVSSLFISLFFSFGLGEIVTWFRRRGLVWTKANSIPPWESQYFCLSKCFLNYNAITVLSFCRRFIYLIPHSLVEEWSAYYCWKKEKHLCFGHSFGHGHEKNPSNHVNLQKDSLSVQINK